MKKQQQTEDIDTKKLLEDKTKELDIIKIEM